MFPDWLVELFSDLSNLSQNWNSHETWDADRVPEPEYFKKVYQRLKRLASCSLQDSVLGWLKRKDGRLPL